MTLLFAGHDTTTSTVAFLFHQLAGAPPLGRPGRGLRPRTSSCAWTRRCGCSRRRGSVRGARWSDYEFAGQTVPAGAYVNYARGRRHRLPDVWEEPHEFRPQRFAPGEREQIPKGAYVPFGGGSRTCIGMRFGQQEIRVIARRILRDFRLELPAGHRLRVRQMPTIGPAGGMPVRVPARLDRRAARGRRRGAVRGRGGGSARGRGAARVAARSRGRHGDGGPQPPAPAAAPRGASPGVRLLDATDRRGSTTRGTSRARAGGAPWLLFIDADVEPARDLLDRLFEPEPGPRTGVLAGAVVDEPPAAGDGGTAALRYAWLKSSMSQETTLGHGALGVRADRELRRAPRGVRGGRRVRRRRPLGRRRRPLLPARGRRLAPPVAPGGDGPAPQPHDRPQNARPARAPRRGRRLAVPRASRFVPGPQPRRPGLVGREAGGGRRLPRWPAETATRRSSGSSTAPPSGPSSSAAASPTATCAPKGGQTPFR